MKTDKIALVIAMRSEAAPLIREMNLVRENNLFPAETPFETHTGSYAGKQILAVVSGCDAELGTDNVGTQAATLMTWLAFAHFRPDLLINAGTAGGMSRQGCEIGDVYLSEGPFRYHDRRIPLPRFREYGVGSYPSLDTSGLAEKLGLKRGRISTGDSLDMTDTDRQMIHTNGAVIKEMEAAAVAWVCRMTRTPMFAVKAITDLIDIDAPPEKQFAANLKLSVTNLRDIVLNIIKEL